MEGLRAGCVLAAALDVFLELLAARPPPPPPVLRVSCHFLRRQLRDPRAAGARAAVARGAAPLLARLLAAAPADPRVEAEARTLAPAPPSAALALPHKPLPLCSPLSFLQNHLFAPLSLSSKTASPTPACRRAMPRRPRPTTPPPWRALSVCPRRSWQPLHTS